MQFCLFNGAVANREFLKMLFAGDPVLSKRKVVNISDPSQTIVISMEHTHIIKRIRNNVLKSGVLSGCTR